MLLLLHRNVCGNNDVKQKAAFSPYTYYAYMYFSTFKHPSKSDLIRHCLDFLSTVDTKIRIIRSYFHPAIFSSMLNL